MSKKQGKIIALYGTNNLGKTTQRELLVDTLQKEGLRAFGYKYADYDLWPSGAMLNEYLREQNPFQLTPREFQTIHVINRMQAEPKLLAHKLNGDIVVVEDYTGTGMAWGIGAGVDKTYLLTLNSDLLKEDLSILLDGERFSTGIEKGHAHESADVLIRDVRAVHLQLAREFGWHKVNANQSKELVHADIWEIIKKQILYT